MFHILDTFTPFIYHISSLHSPMDRTCIRCGKVFAKPCQLKSHHARITPCDPVISKVEESDAYSCKYCNRPFKNQSSKSRHEHHYCKLAVAPADTVLDKKIAQEFAEMRRTIADLTAKLASVTPAAASIEAARPVVSVNHFDGFGGPMHLTKDFVLRAVITDLRIIALIRHAQSDKIEFAAQHIAACFTNIVKLYHEESIENMNIYLNPSREDQVILICIDDDQQISSLREAVRSLFDVIGAMIRSFSTDQSIFRYMAEVQTKINTIDSHYLFNPDKVVEAGLSLMAAHLKNNTRILGKNKKR